jgi:hypothetical protein
MRTIEITEQEYKSLGLVNILSYEIMPFDEVNFPFNYILLYDETIVEESQGYMTPEELEQLEILEEHEKAVAKGRGKTGGRAGKL